MRSNSSCRGLTAVIELTHSIDHEAYNQILTNNSATTQPCHGNPLILPPPPANNNITLLLLLCHRLLCWIDK